LITFFKREYIFQMAAHVARLDLAVDIQSEKSLRLGAAKVLAKVRPDWTTENIRWKLFTDGITNKLIGGWLDGDKDDMVLVRVYGEGTDKIIDRSTEMMNMQRVHQQLDGSKLYAAFDNGICYSFICGEVLTQSRIYEEKVWRGIAVMMAKMHKLPLLQEEVNKPCLWDRLNQFVSCCDPTSCKRLSNEFLSKQKLYHEVEELKESLQHCNDPVVFCHNDVLLANVIIKADQVCFIDFEYGAPNYAAYDIANHFCEFVGADGKLDFEKWLPSRPWQMAWVKEYLTHREEREVTEEEVLCLVRNVEQFMLCASLLWAIWAVIQAQQSDIDFDFEDYAIQRLAEYRRWKEVLANQTQ